MIYWIEMAMKEHEKEWYDEQIQNEIMGNTYSGRSFADINIRQSESASVDDDVLPNRANSVERTAACLSTTYKQATVNVLVVGKIIGELDKYIRNEMWHPQWPEVENYTTFCIGLSLGAHTCGFIGKSYNMVTHFIFVYSKLLCPFIHVILILQ